MTTAELLQKAQYAEGTGNAREAEQLYRQAVADAPDDAQASRLLGVFLLGQGGAAEAESHIANAARLLPREPYMHQNHALALTELGRYDEAVAAATRAIKLNENYALAYFNRANALAQSGQLPQALRDYERAETRGLKDPLLYYAMGHTLAALKKRDDAMDAYERAIALNPNFVEAIVNRGILLSDMNRTGDALFAFDQALALAPDSAVIHNMRGMALHQQKRFAEAGQSYRAALSLSPDYAKACYNFGLLFLEARQYDKALSAFDRAFSLEPGLPWVQGHRLEMRLQLCDWKNYDADVAALLAAIDAGQLAAQPFQLAFLPASMAQQKKGAEIAAAEKCPPQTPIFAKKRAPGRLRVAYVSKDFNNHATAVLFTEALEQHDRAQMEIFGISHGPDDASPERARIAAAFSHFEDVRGLDDRQVALKMKDLGIDIAIDLDGHTRDSRPAILSYRPAPVQASFLAYPGTIGAPHIDYLIGDGVVTPMKDAPFYTEKLANLPFSYQPNGARPDPQGVSRGEAGLPETGFVFGCFNNNFKITPMVFASWMRILARVPGSLLWLLGTNDITIENLKKEAAARGIDPARLVFAQTLDLAPHLARLKQMDLLLDTFIYGAHTTASDALWVDVPLVTLYGEAFPGRVAASLVTALGLPELITHSTDEYENLAVALAADPARLAALKEKLRRNKDGLFNPARFARQLEAAYRHMWERHESGAAPESFALDAAT